ncbi:MAG: methanethiol S-methyltransferase [Planctomycetota bacterium]
MGRLFSFLYGTIAYVLFLGTFLYLIGFVGDLLVPKGVGSGPATAASLWSAVLIDVGLIGLFAVQHTIMARPSFKAWWTQIVPPALERSTFVVATCAVFALMFWQWQPLTAVVWSVESQALRYALLALFGCGWALVLVSTFVIDHFDLFGLRQSLTHAFGREYHKPRFRESSLYRAVRHPLMLGMVIAFWAAPDMSLGRFVFAVTYTVYIVAAIRIEERDLIAAHGAAYEEYRRRVPALLPLRPLLPRPVRSRG